MKKNEYLQMLSIDQNSMGRKLRELRLGKSYSVRDVAKLLFVSEQTIYHWEQGISIPSIDNMLRLAKLYEVSVDDLLVTIPFTA